METTAPADEPWPATSARFRRSEVSATIGRGDAAWEHATRELLRWGIKTRSGFDVADDRTVVAGRALDITVTVLGVTIAEPVRVLDVVEQPDRVGFSYRTLPGHPVDGEEAFIVHRDQRGVVTVTVRSLTRAAPQQPWRALYPALRTAQLVVRRRYLRALRLR